MMFHSGFISISDVLFVILLSAESLLVVAEFSLSSPSSFCRLSFHKSSMSLKCINSVRPGQVI